MLMLPQQEAGTGASPDFRGRCRGQSRVSAHIGRREVTSERARSHPQRIRFCACHPWALKIHPTTLTAVVIGAVVHVSCKITSDAALSSAPARPCSARIAPAIITLHPSCSRTLQRRGIARHLRCLELCPTLQTGPTPFATPFGPI